MLTLLSPSKLQVLPFWIFGKPCPISQGECLFVIPESYLLRLTVRCPVAILSNKSAMLYLIEDQLPSIEGRDVVVLRHLDRKDDAAFRWIDIIVYPRSLLERAVEEAAQKEIQVMGAIPASDYWNIALPAETALWVDDGDEGWVKLPTGEVFSLNSACMNDANVAQWVVGIGDRLKGVVCYAKEVEWLEAAVHAISWPSTLRYRTLLLSALREAPRSYEGVWDLLSASQVGSSRSFVGNSKNVAGLAMALLLWIFFVLSLPWLRSIYSERKDNQRLEAAWHFMYPSVSVPVALKSAWIDRLAHEPLKATESEFLPHLDPLGVWAHLNQDWVWLKSMPLADLKYEGGRWWLGWSEGVGKERMDSLQADLRSRGWVVDKRIQSTDLHLVIAPYGLSE
jgi:hypothetical protein